MFKIYSVCVIISTSRPYVINLFISLFFLIKIINVCCLNHKCIIHYIWYLQGLSVLCGVWVSNR